MRRVGAVNNYTKSARIVGETLKEHPHGDTSVYGAAKNMVNEYDSYIPLLDGSGNWGSIDGDGPAAMRYTDARLSKFSIDNYVDEMSQTPEVVDWVPTFDNQDMEAQYLSSKIPVILVNGNYAIGVGVRSVIAKHNINLVIDNTLAMLDNPNHHVVIPPDQCTPCDIINTDWKSIADNGRGSFIVRGRIEIIKEMTMDIVPDTKYKGCPALEIVSTPDMVTLNSVVESITALVDKKILPQVIRICADKRKSEEEMGCIIILKKGSDPKFAMDTIYKHTEMQHTVTEHYYVLYQYNHKIMSQTELISRWIEYARLKKTRMYYNILQKVRTQLSNKDAYVKVISSKDLDKVISMIRKKKNKDDNESIEWLINNIGLTVAQSNFILSAQVRQLSDAFLEGYKEDVRKCTEKINELENKILNTNLLDLDIKADLNMIKQKYGKKTVCRYIDKSVINDIPSGEFKLIITEKNFIKKIPVNEPMGSLKDDRIKQIIKIDNTENLILFDSIGKVYKYPVHKLPISDKSTNGCDIRLIIKKLTANICAVMSEPLLKELMTKKLKHFIVVQSKKGNIKKLDIEDVMGSTPSGIIYAKLQSGDFINDVIICPDKLDIITYSDNKALRYNISEVPHLMRSTIGNMSMKAPSIDGLVVLNPNLTDIVVITEKGMINRFDALGLLTQSRAKAGNNVIKLKSGDKIKSIHGVEANYKLSITTHDGVQDILVSDIKSQSSVSEGTKMVKGPVIDVKVHL